MSAPASALYLGRVTHRRFRPRAHFLRQRIAQVLLDLDSLPALDRRLRFFSVGRFNLFSFRPDDHGDGAGDPAGWARALMAQAGVDASGPVRLLCAPRVLGYAFNPLSVYFCHDGQGRLSGLVHQVNNTFGERHSYVIPAAPDADGLVRQACAKRFFVSPFMDMEMTYRFTVRPPGEQLTVRVDGADRNGPLIAAIVTSRRRPLDDSQLLRAFLAQPWMAIAAPAGIGWGALRLWLKGVRYRHRPPAPARPATVVTP